MPAHRRPIAAPVSAFFSQQVKRLKAWIRANGRLPSQSAPPRSDERTLATFLNVQQAWIGGRAGMKGGKGGAYPLPRKKLLQQVPELSERLKRWESIAAKRAKVARVSKRFTACSRRSQIERLFKQKVLALKNWVCKHHRLPKECGDSSQEDHMAGFLNMVIQGFNGETPSYSASLRSCLETVPGVKELVSKASGKRRKEQDGRVVKRTQHEQDQALSKLRATTFPTQSRANVSNTASKRNLQRGFAFGGTLTISKGGGFMTARSPLEKHRELVVSLCKLARAANPKFTFTTIQVSKSFATALHSDANNLGPSLTTCLGTFSGGHLYVHGIGMVNVHERFYEFNGNVPHLTCPFKGDRYCIIFSPVSHTDSARRRISDICNLLASTGQSRDL